MYASCLLAKTLGKSPGIYFTPKSPFCQDQIESLHCGAEIFKLNYGKCLLSPPPGLSTCYLLLAT
jgi:hypothetical protein